MAQARHHVTYAGSKTTGPAPCTCSDLSARRLSVDVSSGRPRQQPAPLDEPPGHRQQDPRRGRHRGLTRGDWLPEEAQDRRPEVTEARERTLAPPAAVSTASAGSRK